MTKSMPSKATDEKHGTELVGQIRGLHGPFEQSIQNLRQNLDALEKQAAPDELFRQPRYWQFILAYDGGIRLRQIIESNFHVIETLALLATTRYVFELSIWLKLGTTRDAYALTYYRQLIDRAIERTERQVEQLEREVLLLEELEQHDETGLAGVVRDAESMPVKRLSRAIELATSETDRRASRMFSLYAEQGKTLGFGYTAYLVRTQALPKAIDIQKDAARQLEQFRQWCPPEYRDLTERRWKWSREAKEAGMEGPYGFLYSYISRLLHATPASVTTNQKHLEPDEIVVFLRYLYGAMLDALDMMSALRVRGAQLSQDGAG